MKRTSGLFGKWKKQTKAPSLKVEGPVKILGISASDREINSHSEKMLKELFGYAQNLGAKTTLIRLREKRMKRCKNCLHKKEDICTYPCAHTDDDTNSILEAIIQADCLVVATPVHWADVDSSLQILIEKMTAIEGNHYQIAFDRGREPLFGKPSVLLASQEVEGSSLVLARIGWAFNHMGIWILPWGMIFKPVILDRKIVRIGLRLINERKFDWISNTIRLAARN